MTRVRNATEANLMYVASEIERMGDNLSISREIQKFSVDLYIQALQNDYQPSSIDRASATCLYAAARIQNEPITIDEFAAVSRRSSENIYHEVNSLSEIIEIQIEPDDPTVFVTEYANELGWKQAAKDRAEDLCETAKKKGLHSGYSPSGIAASVLYARSEIEDLGYTQKEIADVAGITDVTIRNRYRAIMKQAPDVDRKDLASRDVEMAFELIETELELPQDVCDRARDRAQSVDGDEIGPGASHAGVAAAAYLETAADEGMELDTTQIAEYIGVSPQTVSKYRGVV